MSFTGQKIEIPLGSEGLTGTKNMSQASPGHLIQATNITLENGTLQKEGGAQHYTVTSNYPWPIVGGWDWWPQSSSSTRRTVLVYVNGGVAMDDGQGNFTTGVGIVGPVSLPVFVEGGQEQAAADRKLFIFSSGPTQVLKGTATTTYNLGETGLQKPTAPSARMYSPAVAGNVDNGAHSYVVTFVQEGGLESLPSDKSNPITVDDKTENGVVTVTYPIGPAGTTARKIYRTEDGDTGPHKLLYTIEENVTTEVNDNVADSSLGADAPTENTTIARPLEWDSYTTFPTFGFTHNGRLWAGGAADDPHRLYYSLQRDHENFVDAGAGSLSIYPGEGEKLIGGVSYKGLAIVWKYPRGIYAIDTRDPSPLNWGIVRLSDTIGGVSPKGHVIIDNDILFVDATGAFQLLSGIQQFGDIGGRDLSQVADLMPFVRENVQLAALNRTQIVYYTAKRQVHVAVCGRGEETLPNRRIVVDFNDLQKPRFYYAKREPCPALWLQKDATLVPRLTMGDHQGVVWTMDREGRDLEGVAYETRFQTAHTDFSYANPELGPKRKNAKFLELVYEPRGNWNLTVNLWWDGVLRETVNFGMDANGIGLDTFILDTHRLGGDSVLNKRKRVTGSGHRLSIEGVNSGLGQDISLVKAYLYFTPSDERVVNHFT